LFRNEYFDIDFYEFEIKVRDLDNIPFGIGLAKLASSKIATNSKNEACPTLSICESGVGVRTYLRYEFKEQLLIALRQCTNITVTPNEREHLLITGNQMILLNDIFRALRHTTIPRGI
jgi:hypothetical protein